MTVREFFSGWREAYKQARARPEAKRKMVCEVYREPIRKGEKHRILVVRHTNCGRQVK